MADSKTIPLPGQVWRPTKPGSGRRTITAQVVEPDKSQITADAALAARVRAAAEAFNRAVDEAFCAGITVGFATAVWTGSPAKSRIDNLRIERQASWAEGDYQGVKL